MSAVNYWVQVAQNNPENIYVFDITAPAPTQMVLAVTNWAFGGNSLLSADADTVAAAVTTAILGLPGVTGCTQTLLSIACNIGSGMGHQLTFNGGSWSLREFTVFMGYLTQHLPLVVNAPYDPPPGVTLITSGFSPFAAPAPVMPGPVSPAWLAGPQPRGTYQASGYPAGMGLFAKSPADGVFTTTQVTTVATAAYTAALTLNGVASVTRSLTVVTPATI